MTNQCMLPDPTCLHLLQLDASTSVIRAKVITTSPKASCPLCHGPSENIHSRYIRLVADLPWMGCAVRLELHVRRFFCGNADCPRSIFTERLPSVVAPYAHRTTRLTDVFALIGFALGGEAGERLVEGMGLSASPDTFLRLVQATPDLQQITPRVLGVDDWSFRRGRRFGTILIDLEKRVPVDLLPDREAATFARWLVEHPGVEIISRDRGGSYAEGAKLGAPAAQQTADRWHLLKNLSEALEGIFLRKKSLLKEGMQVSTEPVLETVASVPWHTGVTKQHEEVSLQRHQERIERYHKIHDLFMKKVDAATIARQVGISRQSVYEYLKMDQPPERRSPRRTRKQLIEPYKDYLIKRWNEGCRSAQQMWREIKEQGYVGSDSSVSRFVAKIRSRKGKPRSFQSVEPTLETRVTKVEAEQRRPPTALHVARLMTLTDEQRVDWQKTYLTRLCQADPVIAQTYDLVQDFTIMLRERQGGRLDGWLKRVQEQEGSELRSFAQGIQRDYDAVKAGLTLEWSNGQVEGQVHRLKLLKRQMYGRGSFQVLRKRVLHRA